MTLPRIVFGLALLMACEKASGREQPPRPDVDCEPKLDDVAIRCCDDAHRLVELAWRDVDEIDMDIQPPDRDWVVHAGPRVCRLGRSQFDSQMFDHTERQLHLASGLSRLWIDAYRATPKEQRGHIMVWRRP